MKKSFALHIVKTETEPLTTASPIPGLHIVANLGTAKSTTLIRFAEFKEFINSCIHKNELTKIGEVYHDFEGGGYTGVVCLTESHLSIHTWPEKNYLTFDVFLSNHLKDNRTITRSLYHDVKDFFKATILFEQIIER